MIEEVAAVMRATIEPARARRRDEVVKKAMREFGVPRPEAEYLVSID